MHELEHPEGRLEPELTLQPLSALEAACEELVAAGRFRDATTAALAAVTADPLRESARSLLITAYLGSGAHVEAARQFVDFHQGEDTVARGRETAGPRNDVERHRSRPPRPPYWWYRCHWHHHC
jgi:hypothetical protein